MRPRNDRKSGALIAPREYGETPVWPSAPAGQGGELVAGCRAAGAAPAPAAPSLSIEEQFKHEQTTPSREPKARKVVHCIEQNVLRLASEYGTERLAFFTLTFADSVRDSSIGSKRFNSLNTGVLARRGYGPWVRILERHKSGSIHFHLIIVVPIDIRTGFDPLTDRGSGSGWVWLCRERKILRKLLPRYSFGRAELVPLRKGSIAASRYLAKYIAKSLSVRTKQDQRVRLVTYSRGFAWLRPEQFSWAVGGSRIWRAKLARWAFRMGYYTLDEIAVWMGARWCYEWRNDIMAQPSSESAIGPFPQYHRQLIPAPRVALSVEEVNPPF